ncbi:7 transmembrane receptor (rhodopsin) [Parelaphostrongylus tenuis]|uniref:7 transmembrane receptor (Rhodopsin) n=1 Tax=Parelaphostrongylus tenuis TaxID=148309 RepID=A0AAD5R4Y9_PARTN|nr:7 transmembrane receptor (rhodopsin) [Parelaphostrongylus tenuis]
MTVSKQTPLDAVNVPCITVDGSLGQQICPTDIRLDPAYYAIYYTYMYTTFLAIGPLTLLILLNICVVYTVLSKRTADSDDSDTISLILVVFFFIFCNFTALLVNFMEIILNNPILCSFRREAPMSVWTVAINGNDKLPESHHALL